MVCSKCGDSSLNLLNVSIKTILLFTTIPANVTIDKPVMVVLNGLPVIKSPAILSLPYALRKDFKKFLKTTN